MAEKMWTYFMQLGINMWEDKLSKKHNIPAQACSASPYYDTLLTDRKVWRDVVDKLPSFGINTLIIDIGEGVQYESHPELAIPGSWTKQELIDEVAHLRKLGIEPIPKLNFSCCHDAWLGDYAYMISAQKYYEVTKDLITEVSEIFRPKYFHLGMDEEDYPDHHGGITTIRCPELWWHDLYYFFDCVEKQGARPMIWSDYYWNHQADWEKKMPKDCVQCNWRYEAIQPKGADGRYPQIGYQTFLDFAKMGYDQLPCGTTWCFRQNVAQIVWLCLSEGIDDEHMLGYLSCPWLETVDYNYYSFLDNAARLYYAKQMREDFYKGTLKLV